MNLKESIINITTVPMMNGEKYAFDLRHKLFKLIEDNAKLLLAIKSIAVNSVRNNIEKNEIADLLLKKYIYEDTPEIDFFSRDQRELDKTNIRLGELL